MGEIGSALSRTVLQCNERVRGAQWSAVPTRPSPCGVAPFYPSPGHCSENACLSASPSLPACLRAFLCACMTVYRKLQFRFATKYRHTDGKLVLKATDDHVVSAVHGTVAHCFVFIRSKRWWTTCKAAVRQGDIVGGFQSSTLLHMSSPCLLLHLSSSLSS